MVFFDKEKYYIIETGEPIQPDPPNPEREKKLNHLRQAIKPLPNKIPLENFKQLFSDEEINLLLEEGIITVFSDKNIWKIEERR